MRALLLAAALALPVAANANDDAKVNKDQVKDTAQIGSSDRSNSDQQPFSQAKVVNKIHHVNNMNIQLGQLAQTRGGTDKIRSFGKKLLTDHQKLDQQVTSYAKDQGITLDQYSQLGKSGSSGTDLGSGQQNDTGSANSVGIGSGSVGSSGNSAAMGGKDDQSGSGAVASGDLKDQGNPGGSSAVNRSGSEMGTTTPNSYGGVAKSGPGSAYEKSGSSGRAGNTTGSGTASAGQTGQQFSGLDGEHSSTGTGVNNGVGSNAGIDNNGNPASTRPGTVLGNNDSTNSANSGPGANSRMGRGSSGSSVDSSGMAMTGDRSQKLDELRNLQGAEFDSQFLSNVIDGSQRAIDRLQSWKGQGDKKLDSLIDKSLKVFQSDVKDAQKLQQRVPAA